MNSAPPQDIKFYRDWMNFVRSAQMRIAKSRNQGLAVVYVKIFIDDNGRPIQWTEPEITKLEPWRRMQHALDLLTAESNTE